MGLRGSFLAGMGPRNAKHGWRRRLDHFCAPLLGNAGAACWRLVFVPGSADALDAICVEHQEARIWYASAFLNWMAEALFGAFLYDVSV